MVTVIEPIVPEVGKKYFVKILGVVMRETNQYALIPATLLAIGHKTITFEHPLDGGRVRSTYLHGDIEFIEEVAAQPEKAN